MNAGPEPRRRHRAVWVAKAPIPTRLGTLDAHVFRGFASNIDSELALEHMAWVVGDVGDGHDLPVRVHSECLTSEVFGSLKCDCKDQLDLALEHMTAAGRGVLVYLRQEGRGIGLGAKIRAYALQSRGLDTVDANRHLGLPDDARVYDVVVDMLEHLGVRSIELMTNNPSKAVAMRSLGLEVRRIRPVIAAANEHSRGYLHSKRSRMRHWLPGPKSDGEATPVSREHADRYLRVVEAADAANKGDD